MLTRRSVFLLAAFAALLAISGVTAWAVWRNTRKAQATFAELHERDLRIHESLAEIRSGAYLVAILARDYMLEPAPSVDDYRAQFNAIQERMDASLRALQLALDGEEARILRGFTFLSQKPILHVLNLDEKAVAEAEGAVERYGLQAVVARPRTRVGWVSAVIEAEVARLSGEEQAAFLADLGLREPALVRDLIDRTYRSVTSPA